MNNNTNLKQIVMTALFAALACVATMSIRIPTPGTGGYIHPGDAIVILSGLGGYFIYVPITFAVKGLIAFIAGMIYHKLGKTSKTQYTAVILGGITEIILVAGGYFLCEIPLYGASAAAASIPANLIQGLGGLIIAFVLYPLLLAVPDIRKITYHSHA